MTPIGLNTFLVSSGFSHRELSLIQEFKSYGAEVIELANVDPSAISAQELKAALTESGLEQPVICGAFGAGRDLRGNEEERTNTVEYLGQLLDLAELLGAKVVCGPFYSSVGRTGTHTEEERRQQWETIAGALNPLCDKAEAKGICLAVEPLNRFETDCINTLKQAYQLIDLVGSPALKIHIDTFHMNIEEDSCFDAIIEAGDRIGHVHASASHRGLLGKDQVDWDGVFKALHTIGYEGDIVIESFSANNTALAKASSIWRPLYDSPEQLAVEGLKFLRKKWRHSAPSLSSPMNS